MIRETLDDLSMDNNQFVVTDQAKQFLQEIAKWAKFLSIVGLIGMGLMVLMGLFTSVFMASMGANLPSSSGMPAGMGAFFGLFYVVIAVIYFFPLYYLLKFANTTKAALRADDSQALTEALGFLKSHYKFIGIFTAILLGLYALILVFGLLFGGLAALG